MRHISERTHAKHSTQPGHSLHQRMQKKKDEEVTANSVQVMHSTMGAININLCQFKVSGNEIEYDKESKKQIQTRPNVRLSNEEYHKILISLWHRSPTRHKRSKSTSNLILWHTRRIPNHRRSWRQKNLWKSWPPRRQWTPTCRRLQAILERK